MATHLNDNLGARDFGGARTGAEMEAQLETSLKNLKTDYIDIYQFHNAANPPMPGGEDGLYDAAMRAKAAGKIRQMLMFELKPHGQPGRHESDAYARMSPREYVARAYMRCCRVAALFLREKENRNEI